MGFSPKGRAVHYFPFILYSTKDALLHFRSRQPGHLFSRQWCGDIPIKCRRSRLHIRCQPKVPDAQRKHTQEAPADKAEMQTE